jgi:LemA protein
VNLNNTRVESVPDSIVARMFNFKEKPLLEFEASEKADVDMRKLFS